MTGAIVGGVVIMLIAVGVSALLVATSSAKLAAAKDRANSFKSNAGQAVLYAAAAQVVVTSTKGVATNIELEKAMALHNKTYTRFYQQVAQYIPRFMRVTRMSLTPAGPESCTLNLEGIIYSNQQYAEATLALLRIPGAQAVTRNGYTPRPMIVPALTEEDQRGLPARPGQDRPLTDPYERFNATLAAAGSATQGFEDLNNYGSDGILTRGPLATGANVTFAVLLVGNATSLPPGWSFDFMVPNPTPTLASAATRPVAGAVPGAVLGVAAPGFDPVAGSAANAAARGGEDR